MDDALSRLARAIARVGEELRARRRKKKRPQRPSGPRPSGPNANKGCGTGAGGFGAGNSCAKEDGIPNRPTSPVMRPVNAKADMAKAKAMQEKAAKKQAAKIAADKAKAEANRPIKEAKAAAKAKQKKIEKLRQAAAERKAAKGERDAAEKQAAAEAAAAKRAALLQKIRIKKANEQIKIVEKPPGLFSGTAANVQRGAGEIETEFVKRQYAEDIKKFHSEADRIESAHLDAVESLNKRGGSITAAITAKESEMHAHFMSGGDQSATVKMREELSQLRAQQAEAYKAVRAAAEERDRKLHELVGEFTRAHAGGTVSLNTQEVAGKLQAPSSKRTQESEKYIARAWQWFSRVASPAHKDAFDSTIVEFRGGGGGSHNMGERKITVGTDDTGDSIVRTAVHEYGHAIESRRSTTMKAIAEDYMRRRADFMAANHGAKILGIDGVSFYECVYRQGELRKNLQLSAPSHLGYARRYSDCQYDEATRTSRAGDQTGRFAGGTEVYSTGVEHMYFEPSDFRRRARHGFDITLLILAGRL